jgi:hypothetical protein
MPNIHVFLGPSLDLNTARHLLPCAYYHPPIQCGDVIRLLRLKPNIIVIIDGLYETIPAVWHKEILFALEKGIEVWGAASMGALRAAELFPYGMKGFGDVFQDFKEGKLSDDDEVAVLHLHQEEQFTAINDAMVNIRATCELAFVEKILTLEAKNALLTYCKSQFYAYRSLQKAIQHLSKTDPEPYTAFSLWLEKQGMVDVKRNDALSLLSHLNTAHEIGKQPSEQPCPVNPTTCFLRELILFVNTTPFGHNAAWFPPIEKDIQLLQHQSPLEYMLLAEIVSFTQKLAVFLSQEKPSIQRSALDDYIETHQLYSPEHDFMVYKHHDHLADMYLLICQSICLDHLSIATLNEYLPIIAHYYALPQEITAEKQMLLRVILVLIFAINQQLKQTHLVISKKHLTHHLKQLKHWRNYNQSQFKHWLTNIPANRQRFTSFLHTYLKTSSVYLLSTIKTDYYQWIYDAYAIFLQSKT